MPTMLLPRRKNDARAEGENENRVEHDVQQPAGDEAAHREGRVPLRAQYVVHHKAAAHNWRAEQNPPRVGARVGKYRGRGAEQNHQRVDENLSEDADAGPERQRAEEGCGAVGARGRGVAAAEPARDDAARAHAEREARRLEDGHEAEDDADRAARARAELRDEVCVRGVVERGRQHAQNRRYRERYYKRPDRSLGHSFQLLVAALRRGGEDVEAAHSSTSRP